MSTAFAPSHVVWLLRYAVQLQQESENARDELAVLRRAEVVRAIANRVEQELRSGQSAGFVRSELDLLTAEEVALTRRAEAVARRADRSGADLRRSEEWLVLARALREVAVVLQARIVRDPPSSRGQSGDLERR